VQFFICDKDIFDILEQLLFINAFVMSSVNFNYLKLISWSISDLFFEATRLEKNQNIP